MGQLLSGKHIILTGCRRGIGREMLKEFASEGAFVWAHARSLTEDFRSLCEETSQKYQTEIRPLCFEFTDERAMKEAVKEIMASKISVDGLVNNAGITYNALFQMSEIEEVKRQMEVNFFAPYLFTQYLVKLMIRNKKGSIVNIASTAGLDGNSGKSAYGASKAALIAMTKSLAEELGRMGIRANCIAPGITETNMLSTMPESVVEEVKHTVDLKRAGAPFEIAKTAVFLLSDQSSYLTGQVIRADGGM